MIEQSQRAQGLAMATATEEAGDEIFLPQISSSSKYTTIAHGI